MTNYYTILGLEPDASQKDIKIAYRKLSKKFHPDLNPNDELFHKMFLQIKEAYDVLSDPNSRKRYDTFFDRSHVPPPSQFTEPNSDVPHIDNFSVDKTEISANDIFTITWKVTNADVVQIRPIGMFPAEGYEKYKFPRIVGEYINLIIIASNSRTGLSAREHITLKNKSWKPTLFEDNRKMDLIIKILRILFILLILGFILIILIFGIETNDPMDAYK